MKIAVTYENGQVFQHFGHTEQFKIYTVDDENILSSEGSHIITDQRSCSEYRNQRRRP